MFWRGLLMGIAELIPGVSGSAIALAVGVYERMVDSLSRCNRQLLRTLFDRREGTLSSRIRAALRFLDAGFLATLFLGMATAILIFAQLVEYLLLAHEKLFWSFFLGVAIGCVGMLLKLSAPGNWISAVALFAGGVFGLGFLQLVPGGWDGGPWFLVFAGVFAACAWLLPGISGSFILLSLGVYPLVIRALSDWMFFDLAPLALGVVLGVLSFARILSHLLHAYRPLLMSFLAGLVASSCHRLWPWQRTLSYHFVESSSLPIPIERSLLTPNAYQSFTGQDPQLVAAISLVLAGFAFVFLMNRRWNAVSSG